MKIETRRNAIKVILWAVVLATCLFPVGLNAQSGSPSTFVGNFTLPYEVHWGKAVLPAGAYSINMESIQTPTIVHSASGKTNMFVFAAIVAGSEKGAPCVTLLLRGKERRVQSLSLPQLGKSLIYEPLTKAENGLLAKAGEVQTVRIITASALVDKRGR
jgi:hypothetical protein